MLKHAMKIELGIFIITTSTKCEQEPAVQPGQQYNLARSSSWVNGSMTWSPAQSKKEALNVEEWTYGI